MILIVDPECQHLLNPLGVIYDYICELSHTLKTQKSATTKHFICIKTFMDPGEGMATHSIHGNPESHGQRNLAGYMGSQKESDMTE